jgi:hypothetical protein
MKINRDIFKEPDKSAKIRSGCAEERYKENERMK